MERVSGTRVVIVTNNGASFLPELCNSLPLNYNYVVVDTGSSDPASLEYLKKLAFPVLYCQGGYVLGALKYAAKEAPADSYLVIHDSMIVKNSCFVSKFEEAGSVVGWLGFPINIQFDKKVCCSLIGNWEYTPKEGVFGSIHYVHHDILSQVVMRSLSDKWDCCQCERALSIIYHKIGYPVVFLDKWSPERIAGDGYSDFKKYLPCRY